MASSKLPAFQFYPSDWRSDIKVQSLSFHDKGIWWEMLMVMHESEERGKLVMNGKPMPDEMVAKLISCDLKTYRKCLSSLLLLGVCYLENGVIFNKRMVKDEEIRKVRKSAGSLGGNPVLLNQTDKQDVNQNGSKEPSKNQPLHSSTSSSTTNTNNTIPVSDETCTLDFYTDSIDSSKIEDVSAYIKKKKPTFHKPYLDLWSLFAKKYKVADVKKMTDKRKNWLNARLRDKDFDFTKILSEVKSQSFALDGAWFGFDWLIQNDTNYVKVLERKYETREGARQTEEEIKKNVNREVGTHDKEFGG